MMSSDPIETVTLQQVRANFIATGSSLTAWCRQNNIDPARAWRVLDGTFKGPKAGSLRERIIKASCEAVKHAA